MVRFLTGFLAGACTVWFWGEDIRRYANSTTRDVRARAADGLQAVEDKADIVLDRAKESLSSALQAGQDTIRPREI